MAVPLLDGFGSLGSCGQISALTTNSTTTLDPPSRAIYISTDGALTLTLLGTTASVTLTVLAGSFLPLRAKQVHACPASSFALW